MVSNLRAPEYKTTITTILIELTADDIATIDAAGAKGAKRLAARTFIKRAVVVGLVGGAVFGICGYLGIDIF